MESIGDVLYLSRSDVERIALPIGDVIRIVEEAFIEKAEGRAEVPPKPGIHTRRDAFIHAMPAYMSNMRSAGVKWVSGYPDNPERGLPYISGLLILNDPETGIPISVMDCTWITAKRTGAATAVAAKYLANKDSKTLGILGCGVQGRSNLEALMTVCENLEEVKAYDINDENLQRYVREVNVKHGLKAMSAPDPRRAVEGSDIVVTAGPILKQPNPVIESSWLEEGGFACPLDFDSYWKPEAIRSMDRVYTDDKDQLAYYKKVGYFSGMPEVYADLGEVVGGSKVGRVKHSERILSMNLGLAIEDMATAIRIYEEAEKRGIGERLPL